MFNREHHLRIAQILQTLDGELLLSLGCYFGGGTAIVLARDEYRESLDIDFLISDRAGYKELRQKLTSESGINSILKARNSLQLSREIRADQYGIRTMVSAGPTQIKFEIVAEGRIELDSPAATDRICGIATLTEVDMATSKLLANSDRWNDSAVHSRDLIDLAMLKPSSKDFRRAIDKAENAYGKSVERDLIKAVEALKSRPGRLQECMDALKMDLPEAVVWANIRRLRKLAEK